MYCNLNLLTHIDSATKKTTLKCLLDVFFPLVWKNTLWKTKKPKMSNLTGACSQAKTFWIIKALW